jgi:transposase InsO family protein
VPCRPARRLGCPARWRVVGGQYTSLHFATHLIGEGIDASIGTVGDALDNALMESTIGPYKTELIKRRGRWRSLAHVELATADWVEWFNAPPLSHRLHATRRVRIGVLHSLHSGQTQQLKAPLNPGRFTRAPRCLEWV